MDKVLVLLILDTLFTLNGHACPEQGLIRLVNTQSPEPYSREEVREQLQECKSRGWVSRRVDDFETPEWFITRDGETARARYKR